ncbi:MULTISPECIES: vanadium-dependent haloperoxidase [Bacillus]|uniref:vanadium-dependent haloperoxidase n=1 Tax=Bacillus TaxID=1386 RepID=UPI0006845E11|nr:MULTISPECIES: vanadium-dependent haloperoxidase [Bacillus]QHZ45572.1 vanadium-dependent haloperoxidase [Bacillus sp. NSP9.1]WFA04624.1 vanadium-dependent haloperoxidase [Bacillus sp. HSf4]
MLKCKNECKNLPRLWSELAYAGEKRVPQPVDSTAGSWPTFFLKRSPSGDFLDPGGCPIAFDIRHPDTIDFEGEELDNVRQILRNLTPEQITIAEYWGSGPATKQWTPIIDRLIDTYGLTPARAARLLANVHAAINDTFVVVWYFKYLWEIPRPNQFDQSLRTIICTPKFPSYPSGHAGISGCAEVVLSYYFPTEAERLRELAEENAMSRVYGGVHYNVNGEGGLRLGRQIGRIIVNELKSQRDSDMVRIDIPELEDRDADLPPPPYRQVIPFPRGRECSSLLDPREDPSAR